MAHVTPQVCLRTCLGVLGAPVATAAVSTASSGASAQPPLLSAPTYHVKPVLAVRVLQVPSSLGRPGIQQLAAELRIAGEATAVVVSAHGSPDLAESLTDGLFRELAEDSQTSRLFVPAGGPGGVLQDLQKAGVRIERVESTADLRARLGPDAAPRLAVVDGGTLSGQSLSSSISGPRETDGGWSPLIFVIAALGLVVRPSRMKRATSAEAFDRLMSTPVENPALLLEGCHAERRDQAEWLLERLGLSRSAKHYVTMTRTIASS